MLVQACCCQSSWLKHPFVQKQGEMQRHCSGSSQSHTTPLCSVPFVGLWGKRKLLCGLLVTMPCSQESKGTLVQAGSAQPLVLRWAFALMWGENLFPVYVKSQMCPLNEKKGALSSRQQQQQLLWHNVRRCWQSRFVLGVQLRAVYWWLAGGSTLLQHRILPDLMPGSLHEEDIKELLEHWEQPERQKDWCFSMSVCCRAEGDIRDFGPENDKCQKVFDFYNNIVFDSE